MSAEQTFGELRSALAGAPSEAGWERVCALCEASAREDGERFAGELLPYVLEGLRGWPDALRVMPRAWAAALEEGGDHACLLLVRQLMALDSGWSIEHRQGIFQAAGLRDVTIVRGDKVNGFQLAWLKGAPMAPRVRELTLGPITVGDADLETLEELVSLRSLSATFGSGGDALVEGLRAAGRLGALEVLWLGGMGVTEAGARKLSEAGALRELALWSSSRIGLEGARALTSGAICEAPLRLLNLGGCQISREGVERIARSSWPLESLMLWGNALDADGITCLVEGDKLERLRHLNIGDGRYGRDALAPLLGRSGPSALRELWLARSGAIGVESWRAAARGDVLRGLEALYAESVTFEPDGFGAMAQALGGGAIRQLELASCQLVDDAALALASAGMPALRALNLSSNALTDAGLEQLLDAPWIGQLETLKVAGNRVTTQAIELIKERAASLERLEALHIMFVDNHELSASEALGEALPGVRLGT